MRTLLPSFKAVVAGLAVVFTLQPVTLSSAHLGGTAAGTDSLHYHQPAADEVAVRLAEADIPRIALNFAEALRSENPGVRESAVYHGFLFRLMFPDVNMHEMNRALKNLSDNETSPALRYRAHLAWYFFESEEFHLLLPLDKIPKEEELFRLAQEVITGKMYSAGI